MCRICRAAVVRADSFAQTPIDIYAYFQKASGLGGKGLARKTKLVDAGEATPGEVLPSAKFATRYEVPTGPAGEGGWRPYRPRGADMRFIVVTEKDGEFTFTAPWGETMVARPGDAIVQDAQDPEDTYRVQKAAFACTYEEIRSPSK
jgi:hypothetical protein